MYLSVCLSDSFLIILRFRQSFSFLQTMSQSSYLFLIYPFLSYPTHSSPFLSFPFFFFFFLFLSFKLLPILITTSYQPMVYMIVCLSVYLSCPIFSFHFLPYPFLSFKLFPGPPFINYILPARHPPQSLVIRNSNLFHTIRNEKQPS